MVESSANNGGGTGEARPCDIRVRLATLEDTEVLVDFACKLAFDTENKTLDRDVVRPAVQKCISTPKLGRYFLAWDENDPEKKSIGTTMLTFEYSVAFGGLIHWIQSVYVNAEARRKGVFRALYTHVCETARADPEVKCVRLYVETENVNAQAVYERLGMAKMDVTEFNEADYVFSH